LRQTFAETVDVYYDVAKQILKKDAVTDEERKCAKTVLLALFYGSGNQVVAKQLKVSLKRAAEFTSLLSQQYPEVSQWKQGVIARAREDGYCETISRRRRILPNINSTHAADRAESERQCVNTIVQGSAADVMKKAMLLCDEKCRNAALLLSVHDELIFEADISHADEVASVMQDAMLQVGKDDRVGYNLSVPLAVHVKRGPSWGEMR